MNGKATVVLVDDEVRILKVLKALFRRDYQVFTTTDGNEAIDYIRNNQVHAIISDQRMPIMPGVEVLKRVKAVSPNTMRLLLTGYADMKAIISSVNEGEVYRYINKPWSNEQLKKTLAEAIEISVDLFSHGSDVNNSLPHEAKAISATNTTSASTTSGLNILVIDDDDSIAKAIKVMLGDGYDVQSAATVPQAFDILGTHHIAVIVSDIRVAGEDMTYALKQLKQNYPSIVSLLLSETKDSHILAALINQAQIFRFLPKPPSKVLLGSSIKAAVRRHQTLAKAPKAIRQHTVEKPSEPASDGVSSKILGYLKSLRMRKH